MSKIATAIIAATAIALTAPALAATSQQAKVIEKNGQTLYCVKEMVTGSRVPIRTCLTKEEWEQRGSKVAAATSDAAKNDSVLASNPQVTNHN